MTTRFARFPSFTFDAVLSDSEPVQRVPPVHASDTETRFPDSFSFDERTESAPAAGGGGGGIGVTVGATVGTGVGVGVTVAAASGPGCAIANASSAFGVIA